MPCTDPALALRRADVMRRSTGRSLAAVVCTTVLLAILLSTGLVGASLTQCCLTDPSNPQGSVPVVSEACLPPSTAAPMSTCQLVRFSYAQDKFVRFPMDKAPEFDMYNLKVRRAREGLAQVMKEFADFPCRVQLVVHWNRLPSDRDIPDKGYTKKATCERIGTGPGRCKWLNEECVDDEESPGYAKTKAAIEGRLATAAGALDSLKVTLSEAMEGVDVEACAEPADPTESAVARRPDQDVQYSAPAVANAENAHKYLAILDAPVLYRELTVTCKLYYYATRLAGIRPANILVMQGAYSDHEAMEMYLSNDLQTRRDGVGPNVKEEGMFCHHLVADLKLGVLPAGNVVYRWTMEDAEKYLTAQDGPFAGAPKDKSVAVVLYNGHTYSGVGPSHGDVQLVQGPYAYGNHADFKPLLRKMAQHPWCAGTVAVFNTCFGKSVLLPPNGTGPMNRAAFLKSLKAANIWVQSTTGQADGAGNFPWDSRALRATLDHSRDAVMPVGEFLKLWMDKYKDISRMDGHHEPFGMGSKVVRSADLHSFFYTNNPLKEARKAAQEQAGPSESAVPAAVAPGAATMGPCGAELAPRCFVSCVKGGERRPFMLVPVPRIYENRGVVMMAVSLQADEAWKVVLMTAEEVEGRECRLSDSAWQMRDEIAASWAALQEVRAVPAAVAPGAATMGPCGAELAPRCFVSCVKGGQRQVFMLVPFPRKYWEVKGVVMMAVSPDKAIGGMFITAEEVEGRECRLSSSAWQMRDEIAASWAALQQKK